MNCRFKNEDKSDFCSAETLAAVKIKPEKFRLVQKLKQ